MEGETPLQGWKEIAKYLRRSERTVQRWERKGLPIRRHEAMGVIAYWPELDLWVSRLKPIDLAPKNADAPTSPRLNGSELTESNAPPPISERLPRPTGENDNRKIQISSIAGWVPASSAPNPQGWLGRSLFIGIGLVLFIALGFAVLASAYGSAIVAFALGCVFVILTHRRREDTPNARAFVAIYMLAGMAYIATASTMPEFQAATINVETLSPATTFLFVLGLKFIPSFVLVLLYWVGLGFDGDAGFVGKPGRERLYMLLGALFLLTEFIFLIVASGDDRVWRAGVPGRWTLLIGSGVVLAVNVTVWLTGRRCFKKDVISSYRPLFSVCAVAYLLIAITAFFIDHEHNRVNRLYLDIRWPETYVASNPDAIKDFRRRVEQSTFRAKVGPRLSNLLQNPEFNQALRGGKFYKQHSDEPFQVFNRAVIFAYKRPSPVDFRPAPFVAIRFPKDLADALQFQPDAEK